MVAPLIALHDDPKGYQQDLVRRLPGMLLKHIRGTSENVAAINTLDSLFEYEVAYFAQQEERYEQIAAKAETVLFVLAASLGTFNSQWIPVGPFEASFDVLHAEVDPALQERLRLMKANIKDARDAEEGRVLRRTDMLRTNLDVVRGLLRELQPPMERVPELTQSWMDILNASPAPPHVQQNGQPLSVGDSSFAQTLMGNPFIYTDGGAAIPGVGAAPAKSQDLQTSSAPGWLAAIIITTRSGRVLTSEDKRSRLNDWAENHAVDIASDIQASFVEYLSQSGYIVKSGNQS